MAQCPSGEATYCEGKEGNCAQEADDSVEKWEDACQHSGDADNDGSVDQLQRTDRQLEASDIEDALIVKQGHVGKEFLDVLLKSIHYRLPAHTKLKFQVLLSSKNNPICKQCEELS